MKQGKFITFEGGEGAGKTTLIDGLARALTTAGHTVLKVREPGGTPLGEAIRDLLLHQTHPIAPYAELCLFLASRAQHIAQVIQPALNAGKIVLCDRFNDSSIAYQGAARHLGVQNVTTLCRLISENLTPDLTLYLDLDPAIGLARAKKERTQDRLESEALAFHQTIRKAFLDIAREDPTRVRLLNASQSPASVLETALKHLQPLLK